MRKIERLLIAVGVIFFASYIIHLPMCNQDYLRKKLHPLGRGYVQAFNLKPEHKRGSKNERYCRNHRKSGKNEIYICESKGYI